MNLWLSVLATNGMGETWKQEARVAALADRLKAKAFGITPENVDEMIERRSHLLKSVFPAFSEFCQTTFKVEPQEMLQVLWDLWLPLGIKLASQRQQLGRPLIQGILGGQGTGKTTMSKVLILILDHLGYRTVSLSLDDLYKNYSERLLLTQQDSRLIWRGPPGTHDIDLGLNVLDQIRQLQSPVMLPRFDKSAFGGAGDRTTSEMVADVDIVLFEGWFVGVRPIEPDVFDTAPPPIVTDEDRAFARDMNLRLHNYLPLWERLDSLIVLYPIDYRCSLEWRKQAEQQMIAAGKSGMSDAEIEQFVNYFWRSLHPELFITPLVRDATGVDLVIEINPDHSFGQVYCDRT
ncbi:glycerate kinase [Nostoc sp. 'Lobaria pulmonaria (5183) cyanobiont']|uniref:glycerate kinase n=1 Tax=Nostoc sp. 'Lobaria pulmonaria (5183) cyanobiont' TaxID=1618022 RepID=UPI000CF33E7A|nr:glycerate kinase [Nostoc sp. 'Lobaria pulmonaria (5183) cyanobiont']AVH73621.1 glycerate kinase [Nostoc sp. 'Lobaria pulmonaria (5183) cyanobiont']